MLKPLYVVAFLLVMLFSLKRIADAYFDYQIATLDQQMHAAMKAPVPLRPIQPIPIAPPHHHVSPRHGLPPVQENTGVCDDHCAQREVILI